MKRELIPVDEVSQLGAQLGGAIRGVVARLHRGALEAARRLNAPVDLTAAVLREASPAWVTGDKGAPEQKHQPA